jgi:hypothetical protein
MSKMNSHYPFGHLKHKLWPKERPGVKLAIWLLTTKSWESPQFPCVQVACNIFLKNSWWRLQLCFGPHFNWRSAHKVMGLQSYGSPNFGNFGTPTWEGVPRQNDIWVLVSWSGTKYILKGRWVNLLSLCLPMVHPCTKMLQLHINQLVIWFMKARVNNWIACQSS